MANKSLPAYLQEILQNHVAQSDLNHDEDLQHIFDRLSKLNESVENIKRQIHNKRRARTD